MRAILQIGDLKLFGKATLNGLNIDFQASHFKSKRKLKNPWKVAVLRLRRNIPTNIEIFDNGQIFLGPLLSYGYSINYQGRSAFHTSHRLCKNK